MEAIGLEEYLYDSPLNRDNYNLLLKQFNPDSFVAFLGAGITSSIKDIPTSKDLYMKLKDKYKIEDDRDFSGPSSFSSIYTQCSKKDSFDEEVFDIIMPRHTSGPMTTYYIIQAFNCFVTTNYYDPVEYNFDKISKTQNSNRRLKKYFFKFPALLNKEEKDSITYLHGHLDLGFCILRSKDYEYFYPSIYGEEKGVYTLENSLAYLFTNKHLVFLGCSLEESLIKYLELLIAKTQNNKELESKGLEIKEHFWVISEFNIPALAIKDSLEDKRIKDEVEKEFFEKYSQIKIKPIVYRGDHIFIEKLCYRLIERKSKKLSLDKQPDVSRI